MNIYLQYIQIALSGAKYHEDQAFLLTNPKNNDYNKIVFHLRAYFWELWSVWDYVLQSANAQTLKLDPYSVRRGLLKKIRVKMQHYQHLALLEEIQNKDWLYKIMLLRDHAHKWQINPYLIDYNEDGVQVIALDNLDFKDKFLPKQVNIDKNDLWFMKEAVKTLVNKGFFK